MLGEMCIALFHEPYGSRMTHLPVCGSGGVLDQLRAGVLCGFLHLSDRLLLIGF